jgi:hypothetical protein
MSVDLKPSSNRPSRTKFAVLFLLALQAILLADLATRNSPTVDEPGHLVAGISYWEYARFEIYRVNPPLVRMMAALPAWLTGVEVDWKNYYDTPGFRPEFPMGEDFLTLHGPGSFQIFTVARWAVIPLVLLGGVICFLWARELYGYRAGFLALTLWVFSPNILGHGSLITSDIPAASMAIASAYTFWKWMREPSWFWAIVAGLVLGLAQVTKTSLLLLYLVWPILWGFQLLKVRFTQRVQNIAVRSQGVRLGAMLLLSLYVLNLGYGFHGTFRQLGQFEFVSQTLSGERDSRGANRFRGSWLGSLPVPFPKDYVLGIDTQKSDFEADFPMRLGETHSKTGRWLYYLFALGIKVPLGIWMLLALSLWPRYLTHRSNREDRNETVLLLPALALFVLVSSQTGMTGHTRYAFVILPFLFIWVSQVASSNTETAAGIWCPRLGVLAACWVVASSLWYYPHSFSYFNELAGGPLGGPQYLLGTNVDWGQNLIRLKEWSEAHPKARPLFVLNNTQPDPHVLGLDCSDVPKERFPISENHRPTRLPMPLKLTPGWYAISVNVLHGQIRGTDLSNGWELLRQEQPEEILGDSMYIFHLTEEKIQRLTRAQFERADLPLDLLPKDWN